MRFKEFLIIAVFLAPLISFAQAESSAEVSCEPSNSSCEFYKCKEKQRACGETGYWQSFGYPYCQKFLDNQEKFSERTKVWFQDVRLCLQKRATNFSNKSSCEAIQDQAMFSHVSCYVDTGFCRLSTPEKIQIYWYIKEALQNQEAWQQSYLINKACGAKQVIDYGIAP